MAAEPITQPSNFDFLAKHDSLFLELATTAERSFSSDPNTTLIKLRQLGEALAQHIAALCGIESEEPLSQSDLLYRLNRELNLDAKVREMFHILRKEGNKATHQFRTSHREAISGLRVARELAIWFHRSLTKNASFNPGPFLPPPDPSQHLRELNEQIEKLKADLSTASVELGSSQELNTLVQQEKSEFQALALAMDKEARQLQEQAKQHDQALANLQASYEAKLAEANTKLKALTEKEQAREKQTIVQQTTTAGQQVTLDEEMTRILIDNQLTEAGWEADSQELTWKKGARPEKGKNKAIAEWPTYEKGQRGEKGPERASRLRAVSRPHPDRHCRSQKREHQCLWQDWPGRALQPGLYCRTASDQRLGALRAHHRLARCPGWPLHYSIRLFLQWSALCPPDQRAIRHLVSGCPSPVQYQTRPARVSYTRWFAQSAGARSGEGRRSPQK